MATSLDATTHRLSEVIGARSHALDLAEGRPVGHSPRRRSCARCAASPGRPRSRRRRAFAVLRGLEARILAVADVHAALTEASALPDAEL